MSSTHDTIVAVSSPPGRSPRGLIRISGPEVTAILGQLLKPPDSPIEHVQAWPVPRRLVPCRLMLPQTPDLGSSTDPRPPLPLPALIAWFMGPRSYTSQDLAEIQCPGNPALLDRLVQAVIALGARLAQPGEFTFRAFLAGKLDLTQAEGVAATIAATSDSQLQAAAMLRQGQLGQLATQLVDTLAQQLALVEAGIDFVDQDDVVPISPDTLHQNLTALTQRVDRLLSQSQPWGALEALPKAVLVGPTSSGKSTLFNALLGQQRAVSSPWANTTRDVLEEPLTLQNPSGQRIEIMLVDAAGLDASKQHPTLDLDRQAQAATKQAIEQADLILQLFDHDTHALAHDLVEDQPIIRIRSKADLMIHDDPNPIQTAEPFDIAVSAVTGQGLEALRALILKRLGDRAVSIGGQALALQPRHEAALRQASQHLQTAHRLVADQHNHPALTHPELIAATLRQALDELGQLGGRLSPDDVLGRVFATFCIGK